MRKTNLPAVRRLHQANLLLLHPFTPFVTEELWTLWGFSGAIHQFENPERKRLLENLKSGGVKLDESVLMEINSIRDLVTAIRSLKAERKQANNKEVVFSYVAEDDKAMLLQRHEASSCVRGCFRIQESRLPPSGAPGVVTSLGSFSSTSSPESASSRKTTAHKEAENLQKIIRSIEGKLGNSSFTSKAPPEVVEGARHQLAENQTKLDETKEALQALQ